MARPTMAVAQTALNDLYSALTSGNTPWRVPRIGAGVDALNQAASAVIAAYLPAVTMTVTDATDATLAAFFASTGELYIALGRVVEVGDVFEVNGAGDTTDNALAAAKGSAVAAGDRFEVTNTGTPAVVYLGATAPTFSSGRPTE